MSEPKLPTSAQLSTWGKALEVVFASTDKQAQVDALVGAANAAVVRKLAKLPDDLRSFLAKLGVTRINGGSNGDTSPEAEAAQPEPETEAPTAVQAEAPAEVPAKAKSKPAPKISKPAPKPAPKIRKPAPKSAKTGTDVAVIEPEKAVTLTKDDFAAEREGLRTEYRKGQAVLVQVLGSMGKRAVRLRSAKSVNGTRYIPHGEFMDWCSKAYPEIPYQTVNLAVRVHEKIRHVYKAKLEELTQLGVTKLAIVLALPDPEKIVEAGTIVHPHTKERVNIYDEKVTVQDLKELKRAVYSLATTRSKGGGRHFHFGASSISLLRRFTQDFGKLMDTKEEDLKDAKEQKTFKKHLIPMIEEWLEVAKSKVGI